MGAKSTTKTEIPQYIQDAGKASLAQAQNLNQMGYVPWMGPDIATYDPTAAMATNQGLSAFGLPTVNTDPMAGYAQSTAGGATGYSSFPIYDAARQALEQKYPGLYQYLSNMTINPVTGTLAGQTAAGTPDPTAPYDPNQDFNVYGSDARLKKLGKL